MSPSCEKNRIRKILFNSESHLYIVDGIVVPSVSDIMRPLSEGFYRNIPPRILDNARKRGVEVHEAIEDYIKFGVIRESKREYVEQFILFLQETGLEPVYSELRLTNGIYAGTVDLLLKTPENEFVLVDVKATNKINFDLLPVQLCGYRDLLAENGYNVISCQVLHLKKDDYAYVKIEPSETRWGKLLNEHTNKVHEYNSRN